MAIKKKIRRKPSRKYTTLPSPYGTIERITTDKGVISYRLRVLDAHGKRRVTDTSDSLEELRAIAQAMRDADSLVEIKRERRKQSPPQLTVADLVERYSESLLDDPKKRYDDAAAATTQGHLKNYIAPTRLGGMNPAIVKPLDIQRWYKDLRDTKNHHGKPMTQSTAWKIFGTLRGALRHGRNELLYIGELVDLTKRSELCETLAKMRFYGEEKPGRVALTREQMDFLLSPEGRAKLSYKAWTVFALALYTGLRQGELFGLCWEDVDPSWRFVTAQRTWNKPGLKNSQRSRSVMLLEPARKILRDWWHHCGKPRRRNNRIMGPIFSPGGRRMHSRSYDAGWGRGHGMEKGAVSARLALGFGTAPTFHSLRHTCCTALVRGYWADVEISILGAQEWMGHKSVQTTMLYLHDGDATRRATAAQIDAAIRRGRTAAPIDHALRNARLAPLAPDVMQDFPDAAE